MKSKDLIAEQRKKFSTDLNNAIKDGSEDGIAQALTNFADSVQSSILEDAAQLSQAQLVDSQVLASRGCRQLTSAEQKYYGEVIQAMKSGDPKQALTNITVAMPDTVIDAVMQDMVKAHPLLNMVNFQNTNGVAKIIINKQGKQSAVWGAITTAITEELSGSFAEIKTDLCKLTAFMPVSKDLLALGPVWLDQYVRAILSEANANGLEKVIITGTGDDQPIGMDRDVSDNVSVTGGVYPKKTPIIVTKLDTITIGDILATIAKDANGDCRVVDGVIMIVNPFDYFKKIMPATTVRAADGTFSNNVLPYPIQIVQSGEIEEGKAIIGIAKQYFMGIGSPTGGKIEFDDSYKFLEDQRIYITKFYGNGRALDNNAFQLLDISGLKPASLEVEVINRAENPVMVNEVDASLKSITIGSLNLSPAYNSSTKVYTATTTNATNSITVVPNDSAASITIKVGSTTIANGAAATWANGSNVVTITSTVGADTEIYTVTVTKS